MKKNQETIFFSRRKWEKILFVMKLKLILILISSFQLSAAVYSQGNKVTLKMENTSLEQVIWEIQKQTDFVFMYGTQDVSKVARLTVDMKDKTVNEILNQCLRNTGLIYMISGNAVIIKRADDNKKETTVIKGVVRDQKGEPLPGVTIIEKGTSIGEVEKVSIDSEEAKSIVSEAQFAQLEEEIELLDGASAEFDQEMVSKGELSPVFFGSALTNFGVETFLQHFLKMTTSPLPRMSDKGLIDPMKEEDFSAFVFKIQANMNKAHRDRIAFMRICSGEFKAGMDVFHIQGGRKVRLSQPQQMMASERHMIDTAYGGDIIGVFDPGIFSIGDTLTNSSEKFAYEGIPTFAPEHFARVRQVDTMKRKQFIKGINEIAQEGAIQIFQEFNTGMEEIIVGVVGVLQFDVLKYRLENEYNVEIRLEPLPYEHIRWIENEEINMDKLVGTSDMKKIKDLKGRPLLLFVNSWSIRMVLERNEGLKLSEFGRS